MGIGLLSANQFCRWLTTREHTLGRLPRNYRYRLPTSEEWDTAWNAGPRGDGNTPGTEVLADGWPANLAHGKTADAFPRTAPVGSFAPNAAGLFDLYGNVMEGCVNFAPAPQGEARVNYVATISARGGSWRDADIRPSNGTEIRAQMRPFFRRTDLGVRVVLSGEDAAATKPAE